jgi:hypothetical protein
MLHLLTITLVGRSVGNSITQQPQRIVVFVELVSLPRFFKLYRRDIL